MNCNCNYCTEPKSKTANMNEEIVRPESATDDVLEYLDDLRESGVTNMYGAAAYLMDDLDMEKQEARAALSYWKKTFSDRHPKAE